MTDAQKKRAEELAEEYVEKEHCYANVYHASRATYRHTDKLHFIAAYEAAVQDAGVLEKALVRIPQEVNVKGQCKILSVGWGNCGCNMCAVETFAHKALKQWREGE